MFGRKIKEESEKNQTTVIDGIECGLCHIVISQDKLNASLNTCPVCGKHYRIGARKRINFMVDSGSFSEWDKEPASLNVLEFPGYTEKLLAAKMTSGENEAVVTGTAEIGGIRCVVCALDPFFIMGSMGSVVGEKLTRAFERATEQKLPVIVFVASGGARMQEGILSLMQMAKISGAVKRHSDAGLLYISVLHDCVMGGVTASFAMEGDIIIAETGSVIGFAGPRVIEQTIGVELPDDFQTAEFMMEKGFIDMIVNRRNMKTMLSKILRLNGGK